MSSSVALADEGVIGGGGGEFDGEDPGGEGVSEVAVEGATTEKAEEEAAGIELGGWGLTCGGEGCIGGGAPDDNIAMFRFVCNFEL